MPKSIKVSIIILTYNHEKYIRQALESVLAQKVDFNYEIIIGDDESRDGTVSILSEYGRKYPEIIQLLLHTKNVGTTRNIADCFLKSQGDYIIAFGGDDYWTDKYKLQKQVDFLEKDSKCIAVGHLIEAKYNDGRLDYITPSNNFRGKNQKVESFLNGDTFPSSSLVFRNIFKGDYCQKYIDLITVNRLVEDFSLCMILLSLGKIYIIDEVMSVYRLRDVKVEENESNYNSSREAIMQFKDHAEILKANEIFFNGKYDFTKMYALKSVGSVIYYVKRKKLKELVYIYKNIPLKSSCLLPLLVFKTVIKHLLKVKK